MLSEQCLGGEGDLPASSSISGGEITPLILLLQLNGIGIPLGYLIYRWLGSSCEL